MVSNFNTIQTTATEFDVIPNKTILEMYKTFVDEIVIVTLI